MERWWSPCPLQGFRDCLSLWRADQLGLPLPLRADVADGLPELPPLPVLLSLLIETILIETCVANHRVDHVLREGTMIACRCGAPLRWLGVTSSGWGVSRCLAPHHDDDSYAPAFMQRQRRTPSMFPPLQKIQRFDGTLAESDRTFIGLPLGWLGNAP